jgi:RNA polymerase sigma-70 factor (ECF subfamily)
VEQARGGDREALEVLLRHHYDRIHAVCRRITGNPADAADATQNALIAVTRGLARFDSRSRFSSWTYRIAINCSLDELRRRARLPAMSLDDPDRAAVPALTSGEGPESAVPRVDIEWALRRLEVKFRAPVVLRDMCGLDYAEIAEVLQLPPGTVRSRIARGRAALARLLEPSGREP